MASFGKFDDNDFQTFVSHFNNAVTGEQFMKSLESEFQKMTGLALNIAKKNTPLNKIKGGGTLRRNWTASNIKRVGNNLMVEIYNNTEYAIYVEMGHRGVYVPSLGKTIHLDTRYTKGQFFLRDEILPKIEIIFNECMEEAFERAVEKLFNF
ncbi:TPA: HK97 gp10 family phage protein [Bacillus cereus]|nr:HK97 gp10 family phage protein [Bacillus cereus]